jgi:putative oxidoreductase
MKNLIISTNPNKTIIVIRFMIGIYFLAGGVLKLYMPGLQETGYFQNIGFASAGNIAITISIVEVVCGLLIIAGLYTRIAAITLLFTILFTFITGKVPIVYEEGFFLMAHLSRIDFALFLGCIFLVLTGSGYWSLDHRMGYKAPVRQMNEKVKEAEAV